MFLFLLASCAQVVAPTGGKRDTTPPRVLKYTPDSAQLNFNSQKIVMDFDEYIQLKDLNTQLLISPPMEKTPDIKVRNKSLVIDLGDQKLKPNTTYSISFGTALQDNNEGNPIDNFKYIFSTGDYLDSLTVKGKVQSAFNHTTEKGLLVLLYSDTKDSVVYKKLPDYFGKTKADGTFQVNNIRPGQYKLFVLKDDNSDYKYNGGETIGFVDALIDPSQQMNILIDDFQEPPSKFFLKKYTHNEYGKVVLTFNTGSDSIHVKNLDPAFSSDRELLQFSQNKDSLTYWMRNYDKDSLKLQISNGSKVLDTLEIKLVKREDALKNRKNPLKLRLINDFNGSQTYDLNAPIRLQFTEPIVAVNLPAVNLREDTTLVKDLGYVIDYAYGKQVLPGSSDTAGSNMKKLESPLVTVYQVAPSKPFASFKESTKYHLFIPPGTFSDVFGLKNDTIKIDFKTQEQKYYGSIKLKVIIPDSLMKKASAPKDFIVQLLDDKEVVYRQEIITGTQTLNFEYVLPHKYKLKIILDTNGNGKWDTGNYPQHVQPERVIYDPEEVNVRSNWDLDLEWNVRY